MLPKVLEELLQALQIFAQLRSILDGVATTFGPKSAETQNIVGTFTNDPSIPPGVQKKLTSYVGAHLSAIAAVQQTNGKTVASLPVPAAAAST